MNKLFLFLIIFILFIIYFHRHPKIIIPSIDNYTILSPAYGTIKKIENKDNYTHVIIFLSPLDVHVQYYPIRGKVINQEHDMNGKFHLAFQLNKSDQNEKVITTIKPTININNIIIQQIAGFVARRISTTIKNLQNNGIDIEPGNKLGMIHLGSRVDLILPSNNLQLLVKENQYVNGPYTQIGYYKNL
jgi:phosphatidylserine decarboxylase